MTKQICRQMFKFLLLIFSFFILIIFLLGFSFVRGLKNLLFGPPSRPQAKAQSSHRAQRQEKEEKEEAKIVRKLMEDAEYVDYEEIKD